MIITNNAKPNLQIPGILPTIHAAQNHSYSRKQEILLFSNQKPLFFRITVLS